MITQGKWVCKKNTDGSWVVMSGAIVVAIFNRKDHPEWNEANARLIAAAPRLLAACNRYVQQVESSVISLNQCKDSVMYNMFKEAIKAAESE